MFASIRERALSDLLFFGAYYFAHLIASDIPEIHEELCSILDSDGNVLVYLPRGHSKSVWATTIYPIWLHVRQVEPFTFILSHTDQQALDLMRDLQEPVTNESGHYDRLHRDFGDVLQFKRKNDHEIVFANGDAIYASSRGASTRGKKKNGKRPGVVLIDDLENEESVSTAEQRNKTWTWYTRTIRPMPRPGGRIVWVGTLLHEDASMPRAERSGEFRVIKRQAIIRDANRQDLWDEWERTWETATLDGKVGRDVAHAFYERHRKEMDAGAETLWPARFPYITLREIKKAIGSFAFATEYQNAPVAAENQIIPRDAIVDFDMIDEVVNGKVVTYLKSERGTLVRLGECVLDITVDPAISEKNTADYFAAGVMATHPTGSHWLVDLEHDRLPFDRQINVIIELYVRWRARVGDKIRSVGIESVMYQKALKQALDKESRALGLVIPTRELRPGADKMIRLQRAQPVFEQGRVHIMKAKHAVAIDELTGWTRDGKIRPTHDDAQDVVLYGIESAEAPSIADLYGAFSV